MDALQVDLLRYGLTVTAAGWCIFWERRERRIQRWLDTVVIKFRAVGDRDPEWPGYFVWKSVQPRRGAAVAATDAWWASLSEDDQAAIEQIDDDSRSAA